MRDVYTSVLGGDFILTRVAPLIGRIFLAIIFIVSGFSKTQAPEATMSSIAAAGLPVPYLGLALAIVVELGGGILIILGWQARAAALALACFSLATAFFFHNPFGGDDTQMIHVMKNIAIAGGFLQIVAFGPGLFSLDSRAN